MRLVGIIGFPLKHSLSPIFQNRAFEHLSLDIRYELWETEPENFPERMNMLRGDKYLGANITIPFKERALDFTDGVDELARRIGAINTIVKRNEKLYGYNTDAYGFSKSLEGKFDPRGKIALIIGAGGSSRAVSFSLLDMGIDFIYIYNRTRERALKLAEELGKAKAISSDEIREIKFDILINTTPLGMKDSPWEEEMPVPEEIVRGDILVYDLVYNPPMTPLLKLAGERGIPFISGIDMLIYQGARAFELWTGERAPVDVMREAVMEVL